MQVNDKPQKNSRQSSKNASQERKSLNMEAKSKGSRHEQNRDRGHASQLLQMTIAEATSAKRSENAISSLEKHRVAASSKKKSRDNKKEMDSVGSSRMKNKGEIETIKDGERWVSVAESAQNGQTIISLVNDEEEDENKQPNHRKDPSKKSKSKNKETKESKKMEEKNERKSRPKSKSNVKDAGSKPKKSAKKATHDSDKLKRTKITEDDSLTNEPDNETSRGKNRKKSQPKQKGKSGMKNKKDKET